MRLIPEGLQATLTARNSLSIGILASTAVLTAAERANVVLRNEGPNTIFFAWDDSPTTGDYDFAILAGEQLILRAGLGDPVHRALDAISTVAASQLSISAQF